MAGIVPKTTFLGQNANVDFYKNQHSSALELPAFGEALGQGAVGGEDGPPPAGGIEHVAAAEGGAANVPAYALGRGDEPAWEASPFDHARGHVARLDRQDVDAPSPEARPQPREVGREARLGRAVDVVGRPAPVPGHRAYPDDQPAAPRLKIRRIEGKATVRTGTDDKGRGRVTGIDLDVTVFMDQEYEFIFDRVEKIMKQGCLITGSLEAAFPVKYNLNLECDED